MTSGAVAASAPLAGCDGPPALVSTDEVDAIGLEAWAENRSRVPLCEDEQLWASLAEVSAMLLRQTGESPGDWEKQVFASSEINAFTLPGRKIGVFEGMFGVTQNTDQLAAIVGHEIGHLSENHAQERISAQVGTDAGLRIIAWLLNLGGVEYANEIASALGPGAQVGLLLPYSRSHEFEADAFGLRAMVETGCDGGEALQLWRLMNVATQGRPPALLATRPASTDRIEAMQEILATLPGR